MHRFKIGTEWMTRWTKLLVPMVAVALLSFEASGQEAKNKEDSLSHPVSLLYVIAIEAELTP